MLIFGEILLLEPFPLQLLPFFIFIGYSHRFTMEPEGAAMDQWQKKIPFF